MIRLTTTAAVLVTLAAGTISAQACNPLLNQDFGRHVAPVKLPASMLARNNPYAVPSSSIVGLWHVVHTQSNGTLLFEGFDTWHSDGTEEELGNLPPSTGAVCLGVWSQNGKKMQLLTHVDWLYDANENWVGTLNMTQSNKLSKDGNSYNGSFDAKFYDTDGNLTQDITGTTAADRLD
ncbi:MAG TPA: hypothetical protein VGL35_07310 [Rhizomicrobium sp.]|jgi:hypothetical protein